MAFSLVIAFRERRLVPRYKRFPQPNVLQPIPEAEVVVEYVMATTWALRFCRISQPIVTCPYALGGLHIGLSNTWNKIQGVSFVIFAAMHWFVEFRNSRNELSRCRNPEVRRPMRFHPDEEVDEPLTGDVVAQKDDDEGERLDNEGLDDGGNNEIHICVSANGR